MASVKRWLLVALIGCLAVGFAYLPPRGGVHRPSRVFAARNPDVTPARRRAQALADEWRSLAGTLRVMDERAHLDQQMTHDDTGHGPVVVLRRGAPMAARRRIEQALDSAWRALGLGETKVRVGLVVDLWGPRTQPNDAPAPDGVHATYLEPDSTHRTLCVAIVPASAYWTRVITGADAPDGSSLPLVEWLQTALGPCAFYAGFGTPGKPVRAWLAARRWDLALQPAAPPQQGSTRHAAPWLGVDPRFGWYWERVYAFPPATVGCLAGRPDACRATVIYGSRSAPVYPAGVVAVDRRWWRVQRLVPAGRYLADVATAVGRDRFQAFWTSPEPVDTALALALREPIGEWTRRWQRGFIPPLRLGAAAPLASVGASLLVAVVAIALVALAAVRRQVR